MYSANISYPYLCKRYQGYLVQAMFPAQLITNVLQHKRETESGIILRGARTQKP
jgi:hypothetical protein